MKDVQPPSAGRQGPHHRALPRVDVKWDSTFDGAPAPIQPLFVASRRTALVLAVGDSVEIGAGVRLPNKPLWYAGEVTIGRAERPQVYVKTTNNSTVGSRWVSPQSAGGAARSART